MSCTFYLRDRKITNEIIKQLDLLEKEFNTKLDDLYKELKSNFGCVVVKGCDTGKGVADGEKGVSYKIINGGILIWKLKI